VSRRGRLRTILSGEHPRETPPAAFLILYAVGVTIYAVVVERPEYVKDGRLADELTELVLGYLSSEAGG
jgi:hypothetical protein